MMAKFSDVLTIINGRNQKKVENPNGKYPIYGSGGIIGYADDYLCEPETVVIGRKGNINKPLFVETPFWNVDTAFGLSAKKDVLLPKYLYYFCKSYDFERLNTTVTIPSLTKANLLKVEMPLPSLQKQKEIVDKLDLSDNFDNICNRIQASLEELVKSRFLEIFGDPVRNEMGWNTMPLEDACISIVDCPHSTPHYTNENTGYMCIRTSIVKKNKILWDEIEYIPEKEYLQRIKRRKPQKGDVIYTREGAILGIAAVIDRDCNVALGQRSMLLSPDTTICLPYFLSTAMNFDSFLNKVMEGISGSASPHINVGDIRAYNIMMPPIELQKAFAAFVADIDKSKLAVKKIQEKAELLKASLMQQYFG